VTRAGIVWAFTTGHAANWHPLTWLSHMLDCELWGLQPTAHHLTNLGLHVTNVVLLLVALARLTGDPWRSALVAGLFALHPLHVESVAWVAERKDVLAGLFTMTTLLAYAAWVKRPGALRYGLVATSFACGLLAKPMLVTLPFVLLLLDAWPLRRLDRPGVVREKLPLLALSFAVSVVTWVVQQRGGAMLTVERLSVPERVANAVVAYGSYLVRTVWPVHLAVFYPLRLPIPAGEIAGAALALAAISALALHQVRRRPQLLVGWLWFLGMLVPVIGLVKVGEQATADRFTYLPHVGLFVMLAWGVTGAGGLRRALTSAAVAALLACTLLTRRQLAYWRDDLTLFAHALAVTSDNYVAHANFGAALTRVGRQSEAIAHYQQALAIKPGYALAHLNLGVALAERGDAEGALAHYTEAVRLAPANPVAHFDLAGALAARGAADEALTHYEEALRLDPAYANAHHNLGALLAGRGRRAEAVRHYRKALALRPDLAAGHNSLAIALEHEGRTEEAIEHYREAARLEPANPHAHFNLAAALAGAGRHDEAIREYATALARRPGWSEALAGAAASYAATGRFDEAIDAAERGVVAAREEGRDDLAAVTSERLHTYREQARRSGPAAPR
jgi:tetratricopeptide (TPR) repeat protein